MKLKELNNTEKFINLSFEKGEFDKFNIVGDYILFDNSLSKNKIKLVKRGKTETTNYFYIDKELKQHFKKNKGFFNSQIFQNRTKKYLVVELN